MTAKISKVLWFFSLLVCLASLMYVYASLPELIVLVDGAAPLTIGRDGFFYLAMGLIGFLNMLVFVINRVYPASAMDFKAWFSLLIMILNFYFVISLSYISLINSGERFDYPRIGLVIYGSVGLIVIWILSWPIYRVVRKK